MKLYEIEEAMEVIRHINGMLIMFSATKKTNKLLIEYLQNLTLELQNKDMIEEVQAQIEEEINFDQQLNFIKYLIDTLEGKERAIESVDKIVN